MRPQTTKFRAKQKKENEKEYKETLRAQTTKFRAKQKEENEKEYKETLRAQTARFRAKQKVENEQHKQLGSEQNRRRKMESSSRKP